MPDMTISLNNDGSYRLTPPFLIVTPTDQEIHWNLIGTPPWSWLKLGAAEGIACDTNPPSPYLPWPSSQRTQTGAVIQVDPDIGNQPEGGMDGDHGKGDGRK